MQRKQLHSWKYHFDNNVVNHNSKFLLIKRGVYICTYQNSNLAHVKVDVVKVGSWTSHVNFKSDLF